MWGIESIQFSKLPSRQLDERLWCWHQERSGQTFRFTVAGLVIALIVWEGRGLRMAFWDICTCTWEERSLGWVRGVESESRLQGCFLRMKSLNRSY